LPCKCALLRGCWLAPFFAMPDPLVPCSSWQNSSGASLVPFGAGSFGFPFPLGRFVYAVLTSFICPVQGTLLSCSFFFPSVIQQHFLYALFDVPSWCWVYGEETHVYLVALGRRVGAPAPQLNLLVSWSGLPSRRVSRFLSPLWPVDQIDRATSSWLLARLKIDHCLLLSVFWRVLSLIVASFSAFRGFFLYPFSNFR